VKTEDLKRKDFEKKNSRLLVRLLNFYKAMNDFSRLHVFDFLLAFLGLSILLLALFANVIGLDNDSTWGASRRFIFALGIFFLLISVRKPLLLVWRRFTTPISSELTKLHQRVHRSISGTRERLAQNILAQPLGGKLTAPIRARLKNLRARYPSTWLQEHSIGITLALAGILFLLVSTIYVWIVSVGYWRDWPPTTNYFELQAAAYLQGKSYLLVEPDPALVELEDPYSIEARKDIPLMWDVSFYRGKYYLYWGPAPALAAVVLKTITQQSFGDNLLVLVFSMGSLLLGSGIIFLLWRRFFDDIPRSMVLAGILVFGLANPIPWMLNRPAVYEAAIAGGQFFLLGSILSVFLGLLHTRIRPLLLFLGGFAGSLAVASRLNLALAVIVLSGMVCLQIFLQTREDITLLLKRIGNYVVPLVIGIFSLGLYNFSRFGSFTETGHRFQLGRWDKLRLYDQVVSIRNIPPNLYNYWLNNPKFLDLFPFIKPRWGEYFIWPIRYYAPEYYHTEQVTGVLLAVPFIFFAAIPIYFTVQQLWIKLSKEEPEHHPPLALKQIPSFQWVSSTLILLVLALMAPLSFFVSASMRHMADVVPTLVLLAWTGYALGYLALKRAKKRTTIYSLLGIFLTVSSALAGILLAVTGYQARFENLNPELFEQITRFFAW
jgi:hypothetical protein